MSNASFSPIFYNLLKIIVFVTKIYFTSDFDDQQSYLIKAFAHILFKTSCLSKHSVNTNIYLLL